MTVLHRIAMGERGLDRPDHDLKAAIEWHPLSASTTDAWSDFASRVSPPHFFARPEALAAWQAHLATDPAFGLLLVWRGTDVIAAMPVMRRFAWRSPTLGIRYDFDPSDRGWLATPSRRLVPVRQFGPVLSLPATLGGPVLSVASNDAEAAIAKVAETIAETPGWDLSVFPVPEDNLPIWEAAFNAAGLETRKVSLDRIGYHLDDLVPLEDVLGRQSGKRRQNFRRARKAAEAAGISYYLTRDADEIAAVLEDLAAKSWKVTGRAGEHYNVPYAGPQQRFAEALLLGPDRSASVASIARLGEVPIAITQGVVRGDSLMTPLTFWDGQVPSASPGLLAMGELIDWAAKHGLKRVDFNSGAPWLKVYADREVVHQNLLVFGNGVRGCILHRLQKGARTLRKALGGMRT